MSLGALIITAVFMLVAVILAVALLALVALPHLRERREARADGTPRHTSRTPRRSR